VDDFEGKSASLVRRALAHLGQWHVNQRIMMPGETYTDFAVGL
jgi:hypothetical protein